MRRYLQGYLDQRNVRRVLAADVPEYLRRPFEYLANPNYRCSLREQQIFASIEHQRQKMQTEFEKDVAIFYSPKPHGTNNEARPKPGEVMRFNVNKIARHTSVSPYWGRFLHLLASEARAENILELGTCAGISGCYLTAAACCKQFWTIEASQELCELARFNLEAISQNHAVINGLFDDVLDDLLPSLNGRTLDLVWIDGHHEQVATIHYFERLKPYLSDDAIVLFDDISWSQDMRDCWDRLAKMPGFSHTFDLKTLKGLGIWSGGEIEPKFAFVAKPLGQIKIGNPEGWKKNAA